MELPDVFIPDITPKMFLEQIDIKFNEYVGKKDRLSIEWGHFSRGMNLEIKDYLRHIPEKSLLREQFNYVTIYWTIKSRLLDLHMKSKFFGQNKIKKERKMANRIKEMILDNRQLRPVSENEIISSTLRRV